MSGPTNNYVIAVESDFARDADEGGVFMFSDWQDAADYNDASLAGKGEIQELTPDLEAIIRRLPA